MPERKKPFYLLRRPKNGIYAVVYRDRPGRRISTGCRDEDAAREWAIEHLAEPEARPLRPLSLREFAVGFFDDSSRWAKKMARKNRLPGAPHRHHCALLLKNYVVPSFGDYLLTAITSKMLDDWLMELHGARSRKPLRMQTKNHVLNVVRIIFREAVEEGLLVADPTSSILPFVSDSAEKGVLEQDEFRKLFPRDIDSLTSIWGSLMWATFYTVEAAGALRPGETRALWWMDWYQKHQGLIAAHAIDEAGERKLLKTAGKDKGAKWKAVPLPSRALQLLLLWQSKSRHTELSDYVFCREKDRPMSAKTVYRRFGIALGRAGIDVAGRNITPYSLRHASNTQLLDEKIEEEIVRLILGHRTTAMTAHYDHPAIQALFNRVEPAREAIEKWFG